MNSNVKIQIIGRQLDIEPDEAIETLHTGIMKQVGDTHYLRYQEIPVDEDGTPLTPIDCLMKIGTDKVSINRRGLAEMTFHRGRTCHCIYSTPAGDMTMSVATSKFSHKQSDGSLHLHLEYELSINSTHASDNTIDIIIRPA